MKTLTQQADNVGNEARADLRPTALDSGLWEETSRQKADLPLVHAEAAAISRFGVDIAPLSIAVSIRTMQAGEQPA